MNKLPAVLLASLTILPLVGCTTVSHEPEDSKQAAITIEDKPNAWNNPYRYIVWDDESYGPSAFLIVARDKGIRKIILSEGGDVQIQCATALGEALKAEVVTSTDVTGGPRKLIPDATTSINSCEIPENIPHPALSVGDYYVVVANRKVSIEGQEPMDFESFPQHLKTINASAIVMRKATIADVLCLRAIAAAADVELKEVNLDGSIAGSKVYGQEATIEKACSQE